MEPDVPAVDEGESLGLMEPMSIGEGAPQRAALTDLAVELAAAAAGFRRALPEGVCGALADPVRAMNCYYSNLIEGHDTHPVDIERALKKDYSADPRKRGLQLEAEAHIAVQKWIDDGGLTGRAATADGAMEIHRRFVERLPEELRRVEDPETGERATLVPGALRRRHVRVGRHVPVGPGAVPRFLARFDAAYGNLGRTDGILATAAAHHRLLWIHPFLDGNGRVARLMSHAMLRETLDTGGIWSVARGLARDEARYKSLLMACDAGRRGDLDGRGTLSEEALAGFTRFFLATCIDQVAFMEGLVRPDRLRDRILVWTEEQVRAGGLPPRSGRILEAVLWRGALPRGDAAGVAGTGERQARRVISALTASGALTSESPRAPLTLAFPARLAARWMPGLFPDRAAGDERDRS